MSKDFEKEYIELAQSEIPDLWDRIEAGLTEKTTPSNKPFDETTGETKSRTHIFLKRYAGLAAAILCVALILPAGVLIRRAGGFSASSEDASAAEAFDTAAEADSEAFYAVAFEEDEAYEAAAEEVNGEAEESSAVASEEEAVYDEDNTEALSSEEKAETAGTTAEEDAAAEQAADAGVTKQGAIAGVILENVTVWVMAEENDTYSEDGSPLGGTAYTVTVCEDPTGTLQEGEQIEIYLSGYSSVRMEVGDQYELDISCGNEGVYPFVVEKIYLQ